MEVQWWWTFILVIRGVQAVAAILFNLLTLVCVLKFQYLRTGSYLLTASLAVCDFLHGLIVLVSCINNASLCLVTYVIEHILILVQLSSFVLLAAERRNSLYCLLKSKAKWTLKRIVILTITKWSFCIIWIVIGVLTGHINHNVPCKGFDQFITPLWHEGLNYALVIVLTVANFMWYGSVGLMIKASNQQVTSHMPLTMMQQQRRKNNIRIASMMAMVFGMFFTLYCPISILSFVVDSSSPFWQVILYDFALIAFDINFWVNPLIYAWRDKKFKKALKTLMPTCLHSNAVHPANNINI